MKKNALKVLALVSGILLIACASVQAQSSRTIRANIPFEFETARNTLPAGDYTIQKVNSETLVLRDTNMKPRAFVLAAQRISSLDQGSSMRLVFHRYGSSYFLSEVWTSGSYGVRLAQSKHEGAIAKEIAKLNQRSQSVEIAVR
jgi:hypothetical protein